MSFCQNCGKEVFENNIYCERCGTKLKQTTGEWDEATEIKVKNSKKDYNKWIRGLSVITGTFTLLGSPTGFQYYSDSKLLLVLIIEIILILISVFLILLGLFPVIMNARLGFLIDIKTNFPEIVIGLLIVIIIIGAIEPQPPGGWWDYYPLSPYEPKTRF